MNRMLLTTAMSAMLAIAAPGVASAHNAKRHHRAHHHHATRAAVRTFGSPLSPAGAGSTTTPPTTPTSGETAGTVTSFTGGVLTITLNNGTTVSGQVTERTELHCLPATPPPPTEGEDRGDDEGASSESSDGGPSTSGHGDGASHSDGASSGGGENGDGEGNPGEGGQSCTTAALVAGAVVREAELSVSSAGAVWDHVDLIG
ncbi:MAG TPA: hypothetical protein VNR42_03790 [Solirubrobacteraceae bacterium]|nr:hypothetical protein [Solirubrobacteraceae bacterium]